MDIQRRNFLRGRISKRHAAFLPPWTREDIDFYHTCTQCGDCISACPEDIIRTGEEGFPQLDFKKGGCIFCGECARACTHTVFKNDLATKPWHQIIAIESDCLTYRGVACQSCQDSCDSYAIKFEYAVGWTPRPVVHTEACTGCGMCIQVCPANALNMVSHQPITQEAYTHGT